MPTALIDGISTRYEVLGSGPPLLMFSPGGFDATLEKWSTLGVYARIKLMDHLVQKYSCIVFDRRETGQSGGRVERVTWIDYVAQGKGLLDLGLLQCADGGVEQLFHDLRRGALLQGQPPPAPQGDVVTQFPGGGDIGEAGQSIFREDHKGDQLLGLDEGHDDAWLLMKDIEMPAQDGRVRLRRLVEGDISDLDPGLLGEKHNHHFIGTPRGGPGKLKFAGVGLGIPDHILDRLEGAAFPNIENADILLHLGEGDEILIVLEAEDGIDELFGTEVVDGVAIGRLVENIIRGLNPRTASKIGDVGSKIVFSRGEEGPEENITTATGAILTYHFYRTTGVVLRLGLRPGEGAEDNNHDD